MDVGVVHMAIISIGQEREREQTQRQTVGDSIVQYLGGVPKDVLDDLHGGLGGVNVRVAHHELLYRTPQPLHIAQPQPQPQNSH